MIAGAGGDLYGGLGLIEKALSLNPNSVRALTHAGQMLAFAGNAERAIEYLERAARLNPLADNGHRDNGMAMANFVAGRYEAAAAFAERSSRAVPGGLGLPPLRWLAASPALLGRTDEAREAVQRIGTVAPGYTVSSARAGLNNVIKAPGVFDALCEGLRRAGLPE
jgi:tetratricopeptide (TPR) repeat protein